VYRRKLDDLSEAERLIIISICALADQLPDDIQSYQPVIAWVREFYFKRPGRARGEKVKGFLETREPRVRRRWDG
jgi:hypothetical protein